MTTQDEQRQIAAELGDLCSVRADKYTGSRTINAEHLKLLGRIGKLSLKLPRETVFVDDDPIGREIIKSLARPRVSTPIHELTSALELPADAATFTEGPSKQTLRRMSRKAEKLGVTWRVLETFDERREILERGDDYERTEAREAYRHAVVDNSDTFTYDTWMASYSATGEPLMISVTGISGDVATLRYFRTMHNSNEATWGRYLMTTQVVNAAVERGCKVLIDPTSPMALTKGLRHFAKMVGFELRRMQVTTRG